MGRKRYAIGNWKMNTSLDEAIGLVQDIKTKTADLNKVMTVLCPPFVWLHPLEGIVGREEKFFLGAQNMYYEDKGPFTGEVSTRMLKELVNYVIIGHSERRYKFGEKNEMINKKVLAALGHDLQVILCIGEMERDVKDDNEDMLKQLEEALKGVSLKDMEKVIVAYEPVWAIGSGSTNPEDAASGKYILGKVRQIRQFIGKLYNKKIAQAVSVLYGGSVCGDNIKEYIDIEIDGVLVGGASLKVGDFIKICQEINGR